jgi:N-acetylglucosamine kinase-like BadF-type ATPase
MKKYVIGIDGGGTKTITVLADLKGKVIKRKITGPSSPTKVGLGKAAKNLIAGIKGVLPRKGEILMTFLGLAAIAEEPKFKKLIKKELLKDKKIKERIGGRIIVESDQIIAFWAGAQQKKGVVLIAGTGCVARGWHQNQETKVSGWDYLADEGSAFWVGQKVLQAVFKDLDKRGEKTKLTPFVFKKLKVKNVFQLMERVYSDPFKTIPSFSLFCDSLVSKDSLAQKIMEEAGKELALSAKTAIVNLKLEKEAFPLVLIGGMFKSKTIKKIVCQEIKKIAPGVKFVLVKEPVKGAVKLALENISYENN